MGGWWEEGSGLGTHVHLWWIHVNVWQNQYSIVKQNKVKIKITMRYHLIPSEWPSSKSLQTISAGECVEKREHSCTVGGNVNCYGHYGGQYGDSLKNQE